MALIEDYTTIDITSDRIDMVQNAAIRSASKVTGLRSGEDTKDVAIAILNLTIERLRNSNIAD